MSAVDQYVRANVVTLECWADAGQDEFNGIDKRILRALERRGLVWWEDRNGDGRWTGGLTVRGRAALAEAAGREAVDGSGATR